MTSLTWWVRKSKELNSLYGVCIKENTRLVKNKTTIELKKN